MTDKNIQMSQRNADNTGWDNLFPKTKINNITDLPNYANKDNDFPIFKDTTGYYQLPNGLIIQWGTVFDVTSIGTQVVFPISFPLLNPPPVTIGLNDSRANETSVAYLTGSNRANFYVKTNVTLNVSWIAIGY
jgi:hypothetical protein